MKKRLILLTGVLVFALLAAGCGKKKEEVPEVPQVTETPTPTPTPVPEKNPNLVDMQQITQEAEKNVMGKKTAVSGKLVIYNKTGSEIASVFIRRSPEDSESGNRDWGDDLVQSRFKLGNGDRAVYYYEKGKASDLYDIQIRFSDENAGECYFRMLPMNDMTQISLCMGDVDDSTIPYARYVSASSKREISTMKEVMKRLGLTGDDEKNTSTPTPTPEPEDDDPEPTEAPEPEDEPDPQAEKAEDYIGMSLDELIAAMGEPNGASYEDEPETGETGYHYYDSFTVSTTVDENGNEVVAGIW